ncbi:MAG: bifunctional phosphopantothenoylcysteine decarboxylase/phosphopantothenate--cysteine ligase CoaBC [Gammaproteobacteria bacterium]|nr:bifunctional phosphopantothenoylcysteine decarboxylase/phosphopantothenate--cysteine ligase CoaBC [Gammaproteobacteria bacterium]
MKLANKHILVAVSGGIAAYKSAEFVRALQREGAQVRVVMTESATKFVTPLTFQALSGYPVHASDNRSFDQAGMDHIALARWSDAIIVAPATANIIAKISNGVADSFVSSLCLAHIGPLAVAPAMNQAMWNNTATQNNIADLRERDIKVFGPAQGLQACGELGEGRMLEPDDLVHQCISLFSNNSLSAKKVVITAGPTIEPIDPVRFISNRSSGKMGYAIADAAMEAGAHVTVISGPTHLQQNERIHYVHVETAQQMHAAVVEHCDNADLFIASAAVADYHPVTIATQKIKKVDDTLTIKLSPTTDILKDIKQLHADLFCVGFAAETENIVKHATEKLKIKSLNMIVANQVGLADQGFDSDYNAVEIITDTNTVSVSRTRKAELARIIIKHIANQFKKQNSKTNVTYLQSK